MPFLKLVVNGPLSSCLCLVEPWLARLDGKCDLKTKMTIPQKLRIWTQNIFACWLLLTFSTTFTSGLSASLAPFGGQTDLYDLQNNLSSKAIWTAKTTFHGVMLEVKSVALELKGVEPSHDQMHGKNDQQTWEMTCSQLRRSGQKKSHFLGKCLF